ncbi:MAG: TRAP transporter small permease [Methylobacteriaceae bacterium]|jgi:TRAP-type C4-dicarboxylate transport system permease small subunit|nr:TRAP transporter small permease [Methylobacteriaceae bacterium]
MASENPQPVPPGDVAKKTLGETLFEFFCAAVFLGMIGLVCYNAVLRYVFRSSFPPAEEWARFLFVYVTFFGAIEAFYRGKHIAVDMFVNLISGVPRKLIDIIAHLLGLIALAFLIYGGYELVAINLNTYTVATGINYSIFYIVLPIMAAAAFIIRGLEFLKLLRKPASQFVRPEGMPDLEDLLEG